MPILFTNRCEYGFHVDERLQRKLLIYFKSIWPTCRTCRLTTTDKVSAELHSRIHETSLVHSRENEDRSRSERRIRTYTIYMCNMVHSDKGTEIEFLNSTFQSTLRRYGIKFYTS